MRYKVLKDFISKNGRDVFKADGEYEGDISSVRTQTLLDNGFIEQIQSVDFGVIKTSKLAKVEIADRDYTEGDKEYFTWEEACAIRKKLNNGWRLPTRSEWVLICEEFGQKDGVLSRDVLMGNLGLRLRGYKHQDGSLWNADYGAFYWAETAYSSSLYAYDLLFNSANVLPSNYDVRWLGFTVRLVRDVKGEE